jgi:hypothetical protein
MDMEGIVIVMEFGLECWLTDGGFGILGFDRKEGWPGAMAWSSNKKGASRPQSNTHLFFFISFHFISFSVRTEQKAIPAKEGVRKKTNWPQTSQITLASFSPAFHLSHFRKSD